LAGAAVLLFGQESAAPLRFVILGDRMGEVVAGKYEAVWKAIEAEKPAFVVGVGDSIQGGNDASAEKEWLEFDRLLRPFRKIPCFPVPGNHDIWNAASAKLYVKHAGHPLDYSFDEGQVHFTMLDNSLTDNLQPAELSFLEEDLKAHQAQPVKFIVSHRPSWLLSVVLRNSSFPLAQLAAKYGAKYVIAGHVHEMMHLTLDGVEYISAPSAGGHLRASGKYEDGWFFGYIVATVNGTDVQFGIHELPAPDGDGRVTPLSDWGAVGLVKK
jgi:predicted phosphodiesterase